MRVVESGKKAKEQERWRGAEGVCPGEHCGARLAIEEGDLEEMYFSYYSRTYECVWGKPGIGVRCPECGADIEVEVPWYVKERMAKRRRAQ